MTAEAGVPLTVGAPAPAVLRGDPGVCRDQGPGVDPGPLVFLTPLAADFRQVGVAIPLAHRGVNAATLGLHLGVVEAIPHAAKVAMIPVGLVRAAEAGVEAEVEVEAEAEVGAGLVLAVAAEAAVGADPAALAVA